VKRVLVIGSNSFSGSDFIDLLLEDPDYLVAGTSRSPEKTDLFLPYKRRKGENFQFLQINLNTELDKLDEFMNQFQPEYIVNFAAQSEVAPSWHHPDQWFQTNAIAVTQLANLLKDKAWLKKYVHISSPEVYGSSCNGSILENGPLNPTTPYAASKAAGDLSLFTYFKNFHLPLVMIRATNVYGPHQQLFKIIPRSAIYLKIGKKIELHGGGEAIKSYIHIRDVSKGELAAMEQGSPGEIYHLSPDKGVKVKEVVQALCDHFGVSFERTVTTVGERKGQDSAYIIDSSKARKAFGWRPEIKLANGLNLTVNWINAHIEDILKHPLDYVHQR
jgi:dTDP-glucose 4,6-dehydratase